MSLVTKVDPIDRDIQFQLLGELAPEARSKALATFAREQLSDAQEINRRATGHVPGHETFVDGRAGAALDAVRPDGTIVFEFDLVRDALDWIGEQLVTHSPVLKGTYAQSHVLFADGRQVERASEAPEATEFVFLNTQPYARKIERGQSAQAPDGVFQAVAAIAKTRFGNTAAIKFSYRALAGTSIMPYQPVPRTITRGRGGRFVSDGRDRSAQQLEQSLRVPAIVVSLYGSR